MRGGGEIANVVEILYFSGIAERYVKKKKENSV